MINSNDSTDIVLSSATNGRDGYSDLNFRCILGVASTAVSRLLLVLVGIDRRGFFFRIYGALK